jgi:hypothetical protein
VLAVAASLAAVAGGAETPAAAPPDRPGPVAVPAAAEPIAVDGVLEEAAWEGAARIPVAWQWAPTDDGAPPVATLCLVTFDREHLYVAFRASDPRPGEIRARFADRDVPTSDDTVGFMVDPFNDQRRAYQFRVNPLGVQMDALNNDVDDTEDFSWDAIWESAGRITADGYVVEVAVPFRQLRFPRTDGEQTWGFLATRDYPRSLLHRLRSVPTDSDRDCLVCQFQPLHGFAGLSTGRNLEVTPTLTASALEVRQGFPDGDFERADEEVEPGLSARWGVSPNVWLSGTLNPDFSQVEADAAQLDVNTRFALFFPERRPFFLESADLFDTDLPLVFTRTVADPEAGLKLAGKEGDHGFGAYFARDRLNNLLLPGPDGSRLVSLDDEVTSGVARWRRDLGDRANLGLLWTGREGTGYGNHVLGVDGVVRVTESDEVRVQVVGSSTRYPGVPALAGQPAGGFEGWAAHAGYLHSDREWLWFAEGQERSPDFRADSGFLNQVGVRTGAAGVQRRFWGQPDDWYSNLFVFLGVDGAQEHDGDWNEWGADLSFTYQGPRQSELSVNLAPNQEHFRGVTYHNFRHSLTASFQPRGWLETGFHVNRGETIDFDHNRPADFVTVSPWLELKLRRFQSELSWDRQDLEVAGGRLFQLGILQTRTLYHFNRRAYLRAILQHRRLERTPALYARAVEPEEESLLTQLLFSYRLNALTVLLAGYSDVHLGLEHVDLTQTDRTVFLKLSYALLW